MKKKIIYGILLVVGIIALSASVKPVQKLVTPFKVVVPEMKTALANACADADVEKMCKLEAENLRVGFGIYAQEGGQKCPVTFMHQPLSWLAGTYCVDKALYNKERKDHYKGHKNLSSFWVEKNGRSK